MLDKREVEHLLPHSGDMALIDKVLAHDDRSIVTEVLSDSISIIQSESGLPAYIGIELMAQSIAAWSGLIRKANNKPPQIGFLLGTRKYECAVDYFCSGDILQITAIEVINNDGLAVFDCEINCINDAEKHVANTNYRYSDCVDRQKGQLLAEAKINVYLQPEKEIGHAR